MSRPRAAIAEHGRVSFAVSGGTSPRAMFAELAHYDLPRASVRIHQVDAP
jgi:6-phosphogluconolactonase/glucosamine-6-phosphate isomerase/deaminase